MLAVYSASIALLFCFSVSWVVILQSKTAKVMGKTKRVRISNERLNSYGTRVLTSGLNIEQYNRNPVLLYMHQRGQVIGLVKDLRVEGADVTGELVFDEATELSRRCKQQWEFGSLKMVSVGIDIIEMSESPEHLVPGQTSATITKSKLFEVSLVDIGANADAGTPKSLVCPTRDRLYDGLCTLGSSCFDVALSLVFQEKRSHGKRNIHHRRPRLCRTFFHNTRHADGRTLGKRSLGTLLELGSEGDVGGYHLAGLPHLYSLSLV